jgi:hypothetical protein
LGRSQIQKSKLFQKAQSEIFFEVSASKSAIFVRAKKQESTTPDSLSDRTNTLESDPSALSSTKATQSAGWIKLGLIATASAFAGGLAAAWWYRNTLKKLHEAEDQPLNPHFGIPGEDPPDEP